jgi:hypothetical protein
MAKARPTLAANDQTTRICLAIPQKDLEAIDAACLQLNMTRSAYVRSLMYPKNEAVLKHIHKVDKVLAALTDKVRA